MRIDDERIEDAVRHTEVLRLPKQSLATFGTTNITYYMVTKPVYDQVTEESSETVVREGRVVAERPRIVTPYYMSQLEGFSTNARRYFNTLIQNYGENAPGLFYTHQNICLIRLCQVNNAYLVYITSNLQNIYKQC